MNKSIVLWSLAFLFAVIGSSVFAIDAAVSSVLLVCAALFIITDIVTDKPKYKNKSPKRPSARRDSTSPNTTIQKSGQARIHDHGRLRNFRKSRDSSAGGRVDLHSNIDSIDVDLDCLPQINKRALRRENQVTLSCSFVGWKATENYICQLIIPKGAHVVNPRDRFNAAVRRHGKSEMMGKLRTDEAIVVGFYEEMDIDVSSFDKINKNEIAGGSFVPLRESNVKSDYSKHNNKFIYEVGKRASPDTFDPDPKTACSHGIHFFGSVREAVEWKKSY